MIKCPKLMRWKCYVLIIGTLVFLSLFRISCFGFRIFDQKNGVFGQALVRYFCLSNGTLVIHQVTLSTSITI